MFIHLAKHVAFMGKLTKQKQAILEQAVRESVCQAALDVLSQSGLEKLTMQRVAAKANIATGTLYNYFKDKDELMVYAAERLFAGIREQMQKVVEEKTDPRSKLLHLILSGFTFFNENSFFFQFLDRAEIYSKIHPSVKQEHVQKVRILFGRILKEGIESGTFRKVDVETTADFFHRAVVGTIWIKPELEVFEPNREARQLAQMFYTFLE